jgi:hypothetical protein
VLTSPARELSKTGQNGLFTRSSQIVVAER